MGRPKKYKTDEERKAAQREVQKRYRERHKEEIAAKQAEWYQQNKNEVLVKNAAYRAAHKEEIAEKKAKYNAAHKEERKAYMTAYREEHKEDIAAYKATPFGRARNLVCGYRQKDKNYNRGECTLTPQWVVDNLFSGQVCHYCGETDWHKLGCDRLDNSLPHTPDNVVCCCGECNLKKQKTEYDEFMRRIGKIA